MMSDCKKNKEIQNLVTIMKKFSLLYRGYLTIHVVPKLSLTTKQRLRFSTWASYLIGTFVLMSKGGWEQSNTLYLKVWPTSSCLMEFSLSWSCCMLASSSSRIWVLCGVHYVQDCYEIFQFQPLHLLSIDFKIFVNCRYNILNWHPWCCPTALAEEDESSSMSMRGAAPEGPGSIAENKNEYQCSANNN